MPGRLRRWTAGIFCALFALGALRCSSAAVGTSATSAVLMDVDSGRVLYASNASARMKIASTTKIMTALVAIEQGDLSDVITVKKSETGVEGTSMYLKPGEHLTLETLLYGLMLCSGNDAAVAIADHVGGSREKFVALMNQRAKALGMRDTSFANPNGLDDPKHYSTALDMAKLACAAMKNETLARIVSTKSVTVGGRAMHNHNKLLRYMDGCLGLKTGFTKSAGRTLVSCAVRNGQRLAAVTLQDGNDWADHQQLYEYGFAAYPAKTAVTMGKPAGQTAVAGTPGVSIPLLAAETVRWPVARGEKLTVRLEKPAAIPLRGTPGQPVGVAVIFLNGKPVRRAKLLRGEAPLPKLPDSAALFHELQQKLNHQSED